MSATAHRLSALSVVVSVPQQRPTTRPREKNTDQKTTTRVHLFPFSNKTTKLTFDPYHIIMSTEEETTPVAAEGVAAPAEDGGGAESAPVVEEESTATFEPVVCFFRR